MNPLNISRGETFTLTPDDWLFSRPKGKSQTALIGLAIDQHVKGLAIEHGAEIPADRFAPYDFRLNGITHDIKSYAASSISLSERELEFAESLIANGKKVVYVLFEQLGTSADSDFAFRGYIDLGSLIHDGKIRESQYSGYYFTLNVVSKYVF